MENGTIEAKAQKDMGFSGYVKRAFILALIIGGISSFVTDIKNQVFPVNLNLIFSILNWFTVTFALSVFVFLLRKINVQKSQGKSFKKKGKKWY